MPLRLMTDKLLAGTGVVAAGGSSAPPFIYGTYLANNGGDIISYAEMIQILGAVYVAFLLLKHAGVFSGIGRLIKWMRKGG